jgi:hypothetical protein
VGTTTQFVLVKAKLLCVRYLSLPTSVFKESLEGLCLVLYYKFTSARYLKKPSPDWIQIFRLRWLVQFSKIQVFNTFTCSNYAFLGFIQQILGFLYILITLLSNYISFSNR